MANNRRKKNTPRKNNPPKKETLPAEGLKRLIEDPEILKSLPQDEQKKFLRLISISVEERFTGPLPPPSVLEGYNIVENGAERIMKMAEQQHQHRLSLEKEVITSQIKQSARGQNYGLFIGIFTIAIGGFLIYSGHDISGSILGVGGVTGLVSVFVIGKRQQRREIKEKSNS